MTANNPKLVTKLMLTIEKLEAQGKSRKVAQKLAYIMAAESLQGMGYSTGESVTMVDLAMEEIKGEVC